ncbi:hypothetical protein HanIR_Chr15g0758001 [Helianthus annuus]|nr:hypothetical protein HanIR_Chr15g0758001 [Helianthus annuus]
MKQYTIQKGLWYSYLYSTYHISSPRSCLNNKALTKSSPSRASCTCTRSFKPNLMMSIMCVYSI